MLWMKFGSRVHITNINVPQNILDLEKGIESIKDEKNQVVRSQKYEEAAKLRDKERQLIEELDVAKQKWEDEARSHREVVDVDNVEEVVAMMTGIPVQKIAEKESGRLIKMADELKGSLVGQDEAIQKVVKAIQRNRAGLKRPEQTNRFIYIFRPYRCWKNTIGQRISEVSI